MLEFIVLGQVPGTHIQLTFFQTLIMADIFVLLLAIIHEVHIRRNWMLRMAITPKNLRKIIRRLAV